MPPDIDSESRFATRHIGPRPHDVERMLASMGLGSVDELVGQTIPESIRLKTDLDLPEASTEQELLGQLEEIGALNRVFRSYIGMGYHDTIVPGVILRNVLENPGWYTQYTPYQAEISQGRLEALLNFQTMVIDLTGMEIANASLLDEATAAAEAMGMLFAEEKDEARKIFFVSEACHPQTIEVVRGRAEPLGIEVMVGVHDNVDLKTFGDELFGGLLQYPGSDGALHDYSAFCATFHEWGAGVVVAADLMALTLLTPPGEFGADIAVGNTQRFGVHMGYGGPHAAYFAAKERVKRKFGAELTLNRPKVAYKETITTTIRAEYKHKKQTGGHGQYGHVLLRLEPLERTEGFQFGCEVVGGSVPREYFPAVEKGVVKALQEGIIAGYPVVDMKVVLYDGSFHDVDSSGISFEIAASHAVRKGVNEAGPLILEPIVTLKILVPDTVTGDIMGDMNGRRGRIIGLTPQNGQTIIEIEVPQAEVLRYATELRSLTQGRGSYTQEFSHYDGVPANIAQKVIDDAKKAREAERV